MMKPSEPFADFGLPMTHAREVEPGEVIPTWSSGEDSMTPWQASDGTMIAVYCSTRNELTSLHNAALGGVDLLGHKFLPGWPWKLLLDELPFATSSNREDFTFPVKEQSKASA